MNDLIRREDALKAVDMWESDWNSTDSAIRALPAMQPDTAVTVQEAARVLLEAMLTRPQVVDPFDATDIEIERMAIEHAGRSVDPVITLETAEKFMLAALRVIAKGGEQ